MARRLFTLLSALSLLLCVAVGVLWMWGRFNRYDAGRLLDAAPVAVDVSHVNASGMMRPAGYVIRKGDLVTVDLYDLQGPETTTSSTQRVSDQGTISLPLVAPVIANGRTPTEVSAAVVDAYSQATILTDAQLDVRVADDRPRVQAWWLAAVFAFLPAGYIFMKVFLARRRRGWALVGRCTACGYDLRGTPGRCPECGTCPTGVKA